MGNFRKRSNEQVIESLTGTLVNRGQVYRDGNEVQAQVLAALFPNGLPGETATALNRFVLLQYIIGKLTRYAMTINEGGHEDSAKDLAGYAILLAATHEEPTDV